MALIPSRKALEKVSAAQYALLRKLTDREQLNARWLEGAVDGVVNDRFILARGFIRAARLLGRTNERGVRRSAASRAYYAAYHAARATFFSVKRYDEDDHVKLAKEIDSLVGLQPGVGDTLRELRELRNEADYSPYPGTTSSVPYDAGTFDQMVAGSIRKAENLVRVLDAYLKGRR